MTSAEWKPEGDAWRKYVKLVARFWAESDFADRLQADPRTVLRDEHAIDLPPDVEVIIAQSSDDVQNLPASYLLIPPKPQGLGTDDINVLGGLAGLMACTCIFCTSGAKPPPPYNPSI